MSTSKLPTAVTLARLILGPAFVFCFYLGVNASDYFFVYVGAVGYAAAALTDMADGYLARRLNSVTSLGALLDPIVDIVNRTTALVALIALGIAPWWFGLAYALLVAQYAFDIWRRRSSTFALPTAPYGKYIAVAYDVMIALSLLQLVIVRSLAGPYFIPSFLYIGLAAATTLFIASRNRSLIAS